MPKPIRPEPRGGEKPFFIHAELYRDLGNPESSKPIPHKVLAATAREAFRKFMRDQNVPTEGEHAVYVYGSEEDLRQKKKALIDWLSPDARARKAQAAEQSP